mmetsp:Transcript_49391/g.124173  ORF Transcript_49391/g.124173 Transcript_49391/m.124173 type:complete len:260 (+) Transcript_49391:2-781(+)
MLHNNLILFRLGQQSMLLLIEILFERSQSDESLLQNISKSRSNRRIWTEQQNIAQLYRVLAQSTNQPATRHWIVFKKSTNLSHPGTKHGSVLGTSVHMRKHLDQVLYCDLRCVECLGRKVFKVLLLDEAGHGPHKVEVVRVVHVAILVECLILGPQLLQEIGWYRGTVRIGLLVRKHHQRLPQARWRHTHAGQVGFAGRSRLLLFRLFLLLLRCSRRRGFTARALAWRLATRRRRALAATGRLAARRLAATGRLATFVR